MSRVRRAMCRLCVGAGIALINAGGLFAGPLKRASLKRASLKSLVPLLELAANAEGRSEA